MLVYLVIVALLLYGCGVVQPVESQTRVIEMHNLPQNSLKVVFGSQENGSCSSVDRSMAGSIICNGKSVLNDGHTPTVNISSNPAWATELFTLNAIGGTIRLSFQVNSSDHDCMKLAVFNCPEMRISLPFVSVYFDTSFRPDRSGSDREKLGNFNIQSELVGTSCDHLLVYCVQYNSSASSPTRYINLVFNNTNSTYVFLGEVTFLKGGNETCDVTMPTEGSIVTTTQGTDDSPTSTPPNFNDETGFQNSEAIIISSVVVAVLLIAVVIAIAIILVLAMHFRKHKQKHEVRQLQNIVMETKEDEKEAESYMGNNYDIIDKPPQNGVKTATESVAITDALYSNPDEVIANDTYSVIRDSQKKMNHDQNDPVIQNSERSPTPQKPTVEEIIYAVPDKEKTSNKAPAIPEKSSELVEYLDTKEAYSHLRDSQKKKSTPADTAMISNEYSKLNRCQIGPILQKSKCSPTPQKPTVEGMMYAVHDKKKKKKKASNKAPAIPDKSSELAEYLDTKEAGIVTSSDADLLEYSEVGAGNRLNSSTGPVPLSNSTARTYVSNLDSNPIYHPTDIAPSQTATVTASHVYDGVLDPDAIYSEPLPSNEHEPEWDPDQNIYEAVYSEPLKPSLFMQEREGVDTEDLHPYTSIYTTPIIPTIEKPLSVSYMNIKEIRSLGNGNFGEVVLAQTFGLMPSQLRLEGSAQCTLVAVKKLKENASEKNKQLFEKEVKFMSRLDHPNVIRLLGVCTDEAAPFIMMEYMSNGDLNQYLQRFQMQAAGSELYSNVKLIETSTLIYMSTQIASAMQYLASQNFIHRDQWRIQDFI